MVSDDQSMWPRKDEAMTNSMIGGKPQSGRNGLRSALIGAAALMCLLSVSMPATANDAGTFNAMVALANKGDAEAQYHVGMMHNNGIGTQKDIRQAFEWFQKRPHRTIRWEPTSSVAIMTGKAKALSPPTQMKH